MSNELMIPDQQLLDTMEIDPSTYIALKGSIFPGASDASIHMAIAYCKAANLDLMQKPVHIVPMWNSDLRKSVDTIMPGISLYRTYAARTQEYVGKSEPSFGAAVTEVIGSQSISYPTWCKITVKRLIKGNVCEFTAKEFWRENFASTKDGSPNKMWMKRPYAQLAKCAEAQALRMAFPEHVGGQPTFEEMDGKTLDGTCESVNLISNAPISEKPITKELADVLIEKARLSGTSMKFLCAPFGIEKLSELNESQYGELCRMLDKVAKKKEQTESLQINQTFEMSPEAIELEVV
ncbi:MAG: phage recombination protein Bet [Pseudomonadota bacterium]